MKKVETGMIASVIVGTHMYLYEVSHVENKDNIKLAKLVTYVDKDSNESQLYKARAFPIQAQKSNGKWYTEHGLELYFSK